MFGLDKTSARPIKNVIEMPKRLPIVMIQSRPPQSSGEQLADDIVGNLIGAPGKDLMLVAPLEKLSADSIDRLTLESLQSDAVILDWKTAEDVITSWKGLGLSGSRAPHELDASVASVPAQQRRLYIIDLRTVRSYEHLLAVLAQIQAAGEVKIFSLLPGPPGLQQAKASSSPELQKASVESRGVESSDSSGGNDQDAKLLPASDAILGSETPQNYQTGSHTSRENKLDLDDLMDELDKADP